MLRRLLPVVVVLLLATAGCSGFGGQQPTTPASPATTTVETTDPVTLRDEAVAAIDAVERYRVEGVLNQTAETNRVTRRLNVTFAAAFDRPNRRIRSNQTVSVLGRTTSVAVYLVNGTLYQYNPRLRSRVGTAWIRTNVSANASAVYDASDSLDRQAAILENASVRLDGTATVDGTETYRLRATTDDTAGLLGSHSAVETGQVNVTDLTATYYLAVETARPVKAVVALNATVRSQGTTTRLVQEATLRFADYGAPVSVTLPTSADTAVNGSEVSATGSGTGTGA